MKKTILFNFNFSLYQFQTLFICIVCITSVKGQNAISTVDLNTLIMPNPKLLLGITYDCRSSLVDQSNINLGYHNTNGTFIPEIDAVFGDFPMSTLRYPANGIMQGFEWKKSIGSINTRIPQQIFAQPSIPAQVMEFGFDEFMAMTASRGVHPKEVQIMVPIYDETDNSLTATQLKAAVTDMIQSNADWVEYANAPNDGSNPGGGTDWATIRAANGHPSPYGIEIWNMGNEPYTPNEYGTSGVTNYINNIVPIIDAMLAIDPTIKITVTVTGRANSAWTDTVLKSTALKGKIYGINSHYFMTEEIINGTIPYSVSVVEPNMKGLAVAAKQYGYKYIVGDNAHAIISAQNPTQAEQDIAMQWQGANLTTDFILTMSQIDNIERSNFWVYGLWSNQWHPIRKNSDGSFTLMPVAAMYKKLSPLFLDNSFAVSTNSPTSNDGVSYSIRTSAFASNDLSKVNVIAVNRDKTNTVPVQINGLDSYVISNAKVLNGASLDAEIIDENLTSINNKGMYDLPAMGILILEYTQSSLNITGQNYYNNQIFNAYPNPTNNQLTFSETLHKVQIYNLLGEIIIPEISKTKSLNTSNLAEGIYYLKSSEGEIKFIVKH